ncbi:Retrovirus-related Pol polyprotein from transposon TNT 1-94 [Gossypium australe]|uniref:Retrovirus-related Pol polyprotein from transposon TNT 1-94 n=1 Tax=Gossypium australe TaxID=47621 RepID=A0A5B6VD78_9ROSI|nr:Retrovirus-related Pol polyprotein from transposon TNT 1-94 [Gossypium australe]
MHNEIIRTLSDVKIVIESYGLKVSRGILVVMRGQKNGRSTVTGATTITKEKLKSPPCRDKNQLGVAMTRRDFLSIDFDSTKLWHMRLGHMSEKDMMRTRGLYGHCVLRKQTRVNFDSAVHRTKKTLDYIHFGL